MKTKIEKQGDVYCKDCDSFIFAVTFDERCSNCGGANLSIIYEDGTEEDY